MLMLEDCGLNKTQIANKLGISPQHLNSMISGARGLSDNFLDNFIKTFNLQQIVLLPNQNPDNEVSFQPKVSTLFPLSHCPPSQEKEQRIEKWEAVSSHTARRSAATNMFKAGIPSISIMKITGHKTETQFIKYIKVSKEENAEMLMDNPFFKN
jgi:hypothetical protein